jgi:hypothetical protein
MPSRAFRRNVVYLISIDSGWHGGAGPKAPERELGSSAKASQLNAFPTHNSSFQISPFMPSGCMLHSPLSLSLFRLSWTYAGGSRSLASLVHLQHTLSTAEQYQSNMHARASLIAASPLAFWTFTWPTPVAIFVSYTQPIQHLQEGFVCQDGRAGDLDAHATMCSYQTGEARRRAA